MNSSLTGPWWNTTCAQYVTIAGCTPDTVNSWAIFGKVWIGLDVLVFMALLSALIRRKMVIDEPFNTVRLVLLLFCASPPLYVHLRAAATFLFQSLLFHFAKVPRF